MDFRDIEGKWRERWERAGVYGSDPDAREKWFLTAAFPYPNSPQHIGHGRTYTVTDISARYWRLRGRNVLYPMAFHVTGTPIIAMAKRLEEKDDELLEIFDKVYGIGREQAGQLTEPEDLVLYFSREIEEGMKEMGYAIDWRRKFYTFDRLFNRFIQWQFRRLKDAGCLAKGSHRVAWCPKDSNVVGAHDTQGDVDPEIEEATVVKFPYKEGYLVTTTYRPETVYGLTNVWVNPEEMYLKVQHGGEFFYLAKKAAPFFRLQHEIHEVEEIPGKEIAGGECETPFGRKVPILPAGFVDANSGTGVVMSVPAHAPYDFLALRDLGKLGEIEPIIIIGKREGLGREPGTGNRKRASPAQEAVERLGVKNQGDPKAEKATKEVYKQEAHEGVMLVGDFRGVPVKDAKDRVKEKLLKEGKALALFIIGNGPVRCRCGAQIGVKKVEDQWFISYGDEAWKAKARECLGEMEILPERERKDYLATIEWLREKACTRSSGLGTRFPFDETKMIEALSDSTLYMAFYTISHLLGEFPEEEVGEEMFDYVFLGKEKGKKGWDRLRSEFLYWYPLDARHSASDLIRNHLPFFIFNHVAVLAKDLWPCGITTNGFVLMEGKKMSKSFGNILPLRKAIREYGADVVRFSVVAGADISQDSNFERSVAEGVKSRLSYLEGMLAHARGDGKGRMEKWLRSRFAGRLMALPSMYEKLEMRELAHNLFYGAVADLQWYERRTGEPKLKWFFENWAVAVSPFMPHFAEEVWERLGKKPFVVNAKFPEVSPELVEPELEMGEELVATVKKDVERIAERLGSSPEKAYIYVPAGWKFAVYNAMRESKQVPAAMEAAKAGGADMGKASRFAKSLLPKVHALPEALPPEKELEALEGAAEFLSKECGCEVVVGSEEGAKHEKASVAAPGKPAIMLE